MSAPVPEIAAELRNVRIEMNQHIVLDDVSMVVPAGGLTAIVGPNGCGKSTISRILTGFLYPTRGIVRILGKTLGETNVHALRERVKLVQPSPPHEPSERMTVRDVVLTGAFGTVDLHDKPTIDDLSLAELAIDQLGIRTVSASRFRICSTGERMRTQLARAMLTRPGLLILDEPTSGLDLPSREQMLATLDELLDSPAAPAILLVTHHVEELPLATRQVILMSRAKVASVGSPADILTSAAMSAAFGWEIDVDAHEGRYHARARRAQ